jgi:hypothetical protein
VNELADVPTGIIHAPVALTPTKPAEATANPTTIATPANKPTRLSVASIDTGGKVKFEEMDSFRKISGK